MSSRPNFCRTCGEKLDTSTEIDECPRCHSPLHEHSDHKRPTPSIVEHLPYKSPGTAALIAFIGGLFGLPGIGQIYVGRVRRGGVILFVAVLIDIFLAIIIYAYFDAVQNILRLESGEYVYDAEMKAYLEKWNDNRVIVMFILVLFYIILFGWSIRDAMHRAKEFNETVKTTGEEPW